MKPKYLNERPVMSQSSNHPKQKLWLVFAIICGSFLATTQVAVADSDGDGFPDEVDNCINIPNPGQRDSNGDGHGNRCDGDLDNNGYIGDVDRGLFDSVFGSNDRDADLDSSGLVDSRDRAIFRSLANKSLGPSGTNGRITAEEAARFLTMTTFGPTLDDISHLVDLSSYSAWLNEQFEKPGWPQLSAVKALMTKMCTDPAIANMNDGSVMGAAITARHNTWWSRVIYGDDQLRQRVALALSEIFVVSDIGTSLEWSQFGVVDYYDMLVRNAFGNYRKLLEEVTLHPAMGVYLGMLRNEKENTTRNIRPDENFARELLQLFSIGVHVLERSGTPRLDGNGNPYPAYTQPAIEQFAKVFTGWNFGNGVSWKSYYEDGDLTQPMTPVEQFHDKSAKKLLRNTTLPANQSAQQDLKAALDNVASHPNVGPFISKRLIQRLVTSNPTRGYVWRVAGVFNNNGQGVRGDLRAVVKAILLDKEARTGHRRYPNTFGKLREPLLRLSHLWRTFSVQPATRQGQRWEQGNDCGQGKYQLFDIATDSGLEHMELALGQNILRSPTVFNFFLPNFSPQGKVRNRRLVGPEFQIATDHFILNTANLINYQIQRAHDRDVVGDWTILDLNREIALEKKPDLLVNSLNLLLMNGQMSTRMRKLVLAHVKRKLFPKHQKSFGARTKDMISLIVNSPEYLIQK